MSRIEPAIILAWRETGARLEVHPDPELAEDWSAVGTFLVWMAGHSGHGGWKFDPKTQRLTCDCGEALFEVAPVASGVSP